MPSALALARALVKEKAAAAPLSPDASGSVFDPQTVEDVWAFFGMTPYPHQLEAAKSHHRFRVEVWHRRAGKTVSKLMYLVFRAWWTPLPRARYAFLGPTYSQVQDIAWAELKHLAARLPGATVKDSQMAMEMPTRAGGRARIRLYGVDSPKQRLRGSYLDGVVIDEAQHIPLHVWTQQVRPMLSDKSRACYDKAGLRNQWAHFIGTPLGKNHFYTLFSQAQAWGEGRAVIVRDPRGGGQEVRSSEWSASYLPVSVTKAIDDSELAEIKATTPYVEYMQEFECDFDVGVEGAIFRHELDDLKARGGIQDIETNPYAPVHLAFDLGLNDATVVWFFQRNGPYVHFLDCVIATNAPIPVVAEIIRDRLRGIGSKVRLGTAYFPHDAVQRDAGTGKDRRTIYAENGIVGTVVPKVALQNGIAATRRLLAFSLFHRTRCSEALDWLALYRREKDPLTGMLRQEPVHDTASHVADALRTAAMGLPRWTANVHRYTMAET